MKTNKKQKEVTRRIKSVAVYESDPSSPLYIGNHVELELEGFNVFSISFVKVNGVYFVPAK